MSKTLSNKKVKSILLEINNFSKKQKIFNRYLENFGFKIDDSVNKLKNHSSKRRSINNNNIVNVVYKR